MRCGCRAPLAACHGRSQPCISRVPAGDGVSRPTNRAGPSHKAHHLRGMPILAGFLCPLFRFLPLARPILLPLRFPSSWAGLPWPCRPTTSRSGRQLTPSAPASAKASGLLQRSGVRGFSPTTARQRARGRSLADQVAGPELAAASRPAWCAWGLGPGLRLPAPTGIAPTTGCQPSQAPRFPAWTWDWTTGAATTWTWTGRPSRGDSLALTGHVQVARCTRNGTGRFGHRQPRPVVASQQAQTQAVVFQLGGRHAADRSWPTGSRPPTANFAAWQPLPGPSWAALPGSSPEPRRAATSWTMTDWQLRAALFSRRPTTAVATPTCCWMCVPTTPARAFIADGEQQDGLTAAAVRLTWAFHPAPGPSACTCSWPAAPATASWATQQLGLHAMAIDAPFRARAR